MTYRVCTLALALTSLLLPACFGTGCKLGCGDSGLFVALPIADFTPLTITTAAPCRAQSARRNDEMGVYVYTEGDVVATCDVRVEVFEGATYTFTVPFESHDTMTCCGTVTRAVDASVPEQISPADGGAGGG
jgi:hypothetical protein